MNIIPTPNQGKRAVKLQALTCAETRPATDAPRPGKTPIFPVRGAISFPGGLCYISRADKTDRHKGLNMLDIIILMTPVLLLIAAGIVSERFSLMSSSGASALNMFTVNLGMPALIFSAIASCSPEELKQFDFVLVFSIGLFLVMFLGLLLFRFMGKTFPESCVLALMASGPNVTLVGLPVLLSFFPGSKEVVLANSITNILLILLVLLGMLMLDVHFSAQPGEHKKRTGIAATATLFLVKNPVMIATVSGFAFCLAELKIPVPVSICLNMLGATVAPCALVALGFLISLQLKERGSFPEISSQLIINGLKFIIQPGLVWLLFQLLDTDPFWATLGVLLAATPSANLSYIVSEKYNVERINSSWAIISTVAASMFVLPFLKFVLS